MKVAVDGPAGSGKSTLCRQLAADLGFVYVDTGAMYRAIALHCLRAGADVNNPRQVEALLPGLEVRLAYREGAQHVYLNGEDVTGFIRTAEVSMATSTVSGYSSVRAFLLEAQRNLAASTNVLMDGRDIGTVVLPDADLKVYLTASPQARAARRHKEMLEKGMNISYEEVLRDVQQRDYQDIHRAVAPLRQAEDAVLLDTSEMDFNQAAAALRRLIEEKMKCFI